MAKPFVKWAGGKGQLLATIEQLLPDNFSEWKDAIYIEPFIGGGAMLFFMLQKFDNIKYAVINDLNPHLITAYETVKNEPDMLVKELSKVEKEYYAILDESGKKFFYLDMRNRFNNDNLTGMEKTVLLIFLNRTCFNGLYRVNSKGEFNVPFGKYKNPKICDIDTIYADSRLLQKVEIINGDFESIEKYVTNNAFIYFDPPYRPLDSTSNFNSYAKQAFDDNEQIRLKNFFDRLSSKRCWMMLSNSDCKGRNPEEIFFDELYKNYDIRRVWASRSVNANGAKRGKITELLIRNYTTDYNKVTILNNNIQSKSIYDTRAYERRF